MSKIKNCSFKKMWLNDPMYKNWLEEGTYDNMAYCTFCRKNFDIQNMGLSAIKSHMKGKKHIAIANSTQNVRKRFFTDLSSNKSNMELSSTVIETSSAEPSLSRYVSNESTLKAEIMWTINVVMKHLSFNSCKDNNKIFAAMFPDSQIAKKYACGADKCAYLLCFGISPYFEKNLIKQVREQDFFVVCFDESMNYVIHKEQMDIMVRFYDNNTHSVTTRYLTSKFLGHIKATDLLSALHNACGELNLRHLLQLGMDGPNVNLKMLKDYKIERLNENPDYPSLIDIGSCSVHTLHRSFQVGVSETDWGIAEILRGLWQIFKDSSARRSDYISVNSCDLFPLKFCATRWVEDIGVANRAVSIWPNVIKFVNMYKEKPKSASAAKSFVIIKEACKDELMVAKLNFFSFVGSKLENYLISYQTDSPMIPFQANDIMELMYDLMTLFIKGSILNATKTHTTLLKLEVQNIDNQLSANDVEIGFAAKKSLRICIKEKKCNEKEVLLFKMDCRKILVSIVKTLQKKNPLYFPIVQYSRCIDPKEIISPNSENIFSKLLFELQNGNILTSSVCDRALKQFKTFFNDTVSQSEQFKNYNRLEERLDDFYKKYLLNNNKFQDLWKVIKLILVLSHGQASVERGFSVNKEMLVENLKYETIISMRVVYDEIKSSNIDISEIVMTNELLSSAKCSRMKYEMYLEENKKKKADENKKTKRQLIQEEIEDLKIKKNKLEISMRILRNEAYTMAHQAELKMDFTLLTKSNAYNKQNKVTENQLADLEDQISELKKRI